MKLPTDDLRAAVHRRRLALAGVTVPVTVTRCTPMVAPLVGALIDTFDL